MGHSLAQGIQLCVFVPVELGDKHLKFGEICVELFLSLLEVGKFGAGSGDRVGVAEGILEDADDDFYVLQLDGRSLNEGENLGLRSSLQPVEGVCHPNSGGWEASGVTEEFKAELGDEPLKGVAVAFVNGGVGDLVSLTAAGCISGGQLVCNVSGRGQLLFQVVDMPDWVCSQGIQDFLD